MIGKDKCSITNINIQKYEYRVRRSLSTFQLCLKNRASTEVVDSHAQALEGPSSRSSCSSSCPSLHLSRNVASPLLDSKETPLVFPLWPSKRSILTFNTLQCHNAVLICPKVLQCYSTLMGIQLRTITLLSLASRRSWILSVVQCHFKCCNGLGTPISASILKLVSSSIKLFLLIPFVCSKSSKQTIIR